MSLERSVTQEQAKEFLEAYSMALGQIEKKFVTRNITV